jgi:hypothetical protein
MWMGAFYHSRRLHGHVDYFRIADHLAILVGGSSHALFKRRHFEAEITVLCVRRLMPVVEAERGVV